MDAIHPSMESEQKESDGGGATLSKHGALQEKQPQIKKTKGELVEVLRSGRFAAVTFFMAGILVKCNV